MLTRRAADPYLQDMRGQVVTGKELIYGNVAFKPDFRLRQITDRSMKLIEDGNVAETLKVLKQSERSPDLFDKPVETAARQLIARLPVMSHPPVERFSYPRFVDELTALLNDPELKPEHFVPLVPFNTDSKRTARGFLGKVPVSILLLPQRSLGLCQNVLWAVEEAQPYDLDVSSLVAVAPAAQKKQSFNFRRYLEKVADRITGSELNSVTNANMEMESATLFDSDSIYDPETLHNFEDFVWKDVRSRSQAEWR